MNCIIIEDAQGSAEHLENLLALTGYEIKVNARPDTVESAVSWLKNNHTDLIFLDIQLGDSLSFEIFDHVQVTTPVIFTTSYNQYAIKAFDVNSIAYLLKPIMLADLMQALEKYKQLFDYVHAINEKMIPLQQGYQKRFLVQSGNMILPVPVEEIAYFRTTHHGKYVLATTKEKNQYLIDNKLEVLELRLDPENFFRINRQYIISSGAVRGIYPADNGRLKIDIIPETKEEIFIPKERTFLFKNWLTRSS